MSFRDVLYRPDRRDISEMSIDVLLREIEKETSLPDYKERLRNPVYLSYIRSLNFAVRGKLEQRRCDIQTQKIKDRINARVVDESKVVQRSETVQKNCPSCGHHVAVETSAYWFCGVERCGTKHKTRETAVYCLKKKGKQNRTITYRLMERSRKMLASHIMEKTDCTLRQLGNQFLVSRERARQISITGDRLRYSEKSLNHWRPVAGWPSREGDSNAY